MIVKAFVEDETGLGFDGGNGDEEDAGEWDKDPLEDERKTFPEADVGAFWENVDGDDGRDENTNGGDVEHSGRETGDVIGEDGIMVFTVEHLWKPTGEGQENRCGGPIKMIQKKGTYGMPTFEPRNIFIIVEVQYDKRKISDTP